MEIVPTDRLPEPHPEDVPALAEALREAASHRPEIEQAELNLRNQEVDDPGNPEQVAALARCLCLVQPLGAGRRAPSHPREYS